MERRGCRWQRGAQGKKKKKKRQEGEEEGQEGEKEEGREAWVGKRWRDAPTAVSEEEQKGLHQPTSGASAWQVDRGCDGDAGPDGEGWLLEV